MKQVFNYKKLIFLHPILFESLGEPGKKSIFTLKPVWRKYMEYTLKSKKSGCCLECGHSIQYGRSDKKFCSDSCKNSWHNRQRKEFLKVHSKVLHVLDKNYSILEHCLLKGKTSLDLGDAVQWGFNPEYITGLRSYRMRMEFRCFDIKYLRSDNKIYNIEKVPFISDSE